MNTSTHSWTIGGILNWTRQYFSDKGVENPRLDAEVLLSRILGLDRVHLYVRFDQPLEHTELAAFREFVKRRAMRFPVAYITGSKEFMGLDFAVNPAVLIPRPDTEILVEGAVDLLRDRERPQILDLGTGSGAIIVSTLTKLPGAQGTAVDISAEALAVAKTNAERHAVADRLIIRQGDLFEPVSGETYDAILSNPPYIPDGEIAGLEPEVQREPHLALAGGTDGLDYYRRIISAGPQHVKPGGFIAVEVGINQAQAVAAIADASGALKIQATLKDYAGIERVVVMRAM